MTHCPVSCMHLKIPMDCHASKNLLTISESESISILHVNTKHDFFHGFIYSEFSRTETTG